MKEAEEMTSTEFVKRSEYDQRAIPTRVAKEREVRKRDAAELEARNSDLELTVLNLTQRRKELEAECIRLHELWSVANHAVAEHSTLGHQLFGANGTFPCALTMGQDVVLDGMKWLEQYNSDLATTILNLTKECDSYRDKLASAEWKYANLPKRITELAHDRDKIAENRKYWMDRATTAEAKLTNILDTIATLR